MRHFTLLVTFFISLIIFKVDAQERYLEPVFDEVAVSAITPVASNYTIMPWIFAALQMQQGHTAKQPLVAQFYTPVGDTVTNRPLVIYLHTGNFMPYEINGACGGTMRDSSNVEIATRLAKMGYVVAVVNYRQGWNPLHPQELVRRFFLINAAYRGVQDLSTYVRYFRYSVDKLGNVHGIDPDKITVWGQGTGGYLSLASAYLKSYPEIFATEDPTKFILPTQAGNLPMVIEKYNGNITSTGDITTVDATYNAITTLPVGDTLSKPNYPGYSSDFALAVNMGGALGDSSWMNKMEIPVISFHVPSDKFAPCETDVLNVPTLTGPQPVVEVSGSCDVQARADLLGLNDVFSSIPTNKWNPYSSTSNLGFYSFTGTPDESSSPWEWMSASTPKPTTDPNTTGCNTDKSSALKYIDTIMAFYAPRACFALGLSSCAAKVSTKDLSDTNVNLVMAPNPASTEINLSVGDDTPIKSFSLYDISGFMLKNVVDVNSSNVTIKRDNLDSGMYIVKMQFDKGVLSKRIVFK